MAAFFVRYSPALPSEVSRLLTAAVINQKFRTLLLTNPAFAIEHGFQGEPFHLEREQKERILAIQAGSLADLARQLTADDEFTHQNNHDLSVADPVRYIGISV